MYVTPEQIQSANKANVEALLAVANAQFAAFEKLANISASAVKPPTSISLLRLRRSSSRKQLVTTPASRIMRKLTSAFQEIETNTACRVAIPRANLWSYAMARIIATITVGAIAKK